MFGKDAAAIYSGWLIEFSWMSISDVYFLPHDTLAVKQIASVFTARSCQDMSGGHTINAL